MRLWGEPFGVPMASSTKDGLMSKEDKAKVDAGSIFTESAKPASVLLTVEDLNGETLITNLNQTLDIVYTLPPAVSGLSGRILLVTTVAKYVHLDPNASDYIVLDNDKGGDGEYIGVAAASEGNCVDIYTAETGTGVYNWMATTVSGAWLQEA